MAEKEGFVFAFSLIFLVLAFFSFLAFVEAASIPQPPSLINVTSNESRGITPQAGAILNTSGGYITTVNLTARTQNTRWKAFVGWVTGKYALDNANGSTIYDWTMATTTGNVYATRNSSVISWSNINCSNITNIGYENAYLNHSNNSLDNLTSTFSDQTHDSFYVGTVFIPTNNCFGTNTYVNNATQSADFEEEVLFDGVSIVYAALLEPGGKVGFNSVSYDFQMIVPENGARTWTGTTPYYLYVELS